MAVLIMIISVTFSSVSRPTIRPPDITGIVAHCLARMDSTAFSKETASSTRIAIGAHALGHRNVMAAFRKCFNQVIAPKHTDRFFVIHNGEILLGTGE
jgi:hypothetical protein